MTSRQHQDWINRGKPDSGLALPLQLLANTLAAAGYTVYVYPNDEHLNAQPPEDHTYYSETGWPHASPKWWRHAIDIMPGPGGAAGLQRIGQNLFNARQAGQITWLKYMNWPSDGNLSHAVQDRWEPSHSRGSSSDTGHIHISSVTGCETLDDAYNPLTSVVVVSSPGPGTATTEELPMFLASQGNQFFLCNGMVSRPISRAAIGDLRTLVAEGLVQPVAHLDSPRGGWYDGAFGALELTSSNPPPTPTFSAQLTDAQVSALAADVVAGLASAAPGAQLTAANVADELAKRLQA